MIEPPIPVDEANRLEALKRLLILDTKPEERFDRITRCATLIFKVPISTLTMVDAKREWYKSCQGLEEHEKDRAISFCAHALVEREGLVVLDTTKDPRFADNPMVVGSPYLRFYAGIPVVSAGGFNVGVFCIKDTKPHENFDEEEEEVLKGLAAWAELELNSRELSLALAERRRAEVELGERLKEVEEERVKNEAILTSIGDGVIVVDSGGVVVIVNHLTLKMLGVAKEEIIGKRFTDMWPILDKSGSEVATEKRPMQVVLTTGKAVTSSMAEPLYYMRKDKTKFPVAVVVTPVVIRGVNRGAVEVFRDVSREQEIDKAKTEFVSLASHQLRAPLTAISWSTEMLLAGDAGKLTEEQRKLVDEVYSGNKRMIELVNDLLSVSRLEMGTLKISSEEADVVALCEGTLKELEQKINGKSLEVERHYQENLARVVADPKLLAMIVQNLLENALDYTQEKGRIGLTVKGDGGWVTLAIADSGVGIPEADQPKIFTKFFRASNAEKQRSGGNGLGLYIVKTVVEQMGGKVWFASLENSGTTFTVSLPAVKNKVG